MSLWNGVSEELTPSHTFCTDLPLHGKATAVVTGLEHQPPLDPSQVILA